MLYRSKPVFIKAFKLGVDEFPIWFKDMLDTEDVAFHETLGAYYQTPDGCRIAEIGDFIIRNDAGEISHMKPDIFLETYEKVLHGGSYEIPVLTVKRFESDVEPIPAKVYPFPDEGDRVFLKE